MHSFLLWSFFICLLTISYKLIYCICAWTLLIILSWIFSTDSKHNQVGVTRVNRHSRHQFQYALSRIFACGSGGSPGYGVGLWLKLILFIITFDLVLNISYCVDWGLKRINRTIYIKINLEYCYSHNSYLKIFSYVIFSQ